MVVDVNGGECDLVRDRKLMEDGRLNEKEGVDITVNTIFYT